MFHSEFDHLPWTQRIADSPDDRASPKPEKTGRSCPLQKSDGPFPGYQDHLATPDFCDAKTLSGIGDPRTPTHEDILSSEPDQGPVAVDGDQSAGRGLFLRQFRYWIFLFSSRRRSVGGTFFCRNRLAHLFEELPVVQVDDGLVDVGGIGSEGRSIASRNRKEQDRKSGPEDSKNHRGFPFVFANCGFVFFCIPAIR